MRVGIRIEIKKDKESGIYSAEAHFGNNIFICSNIKNREDAIQCSNEAKELLNKIKLSKLKATLTDVEINNLSYNEIPFSDKGIFDDMLRNLLRGNFVKTAKFIRDRLFEINLKDINDEEEIKI